MDVIYCQMCDGTFIGFNPDVGESVECPYCKCTGYGTYDVLGNYYVEWY